MTTSDTRWPRVDAAAESDAYRRLGEVYRKLIVEALETIVGRSERDPAYAFIDTKLNVATGEDFAEDDPIRGRGTIYGWIQGRGIEALAGHVTWLGEAHAPLAHRTRAVLARVTDHLESVRKANHGRLHFMMDRDGRPLTLDARGRVVHAPVESDADGPATTLTDMFYAKGLAAAGRVLYEQAYIDDAIALMRRIEADLAVGRFYSDQQQLDPRNPVGRMPGLHGQGPHMIAIGGCTVFLGVTGDPHWAHAGIAHIEHVLSRHVRSARFDDDRPGEPGEMWEHVDASGAPWIDRAETGGPDVVRNDPGHATELAGLALRHLRACEAAGVTPTNIEALRDRLVEILERNFANGFRHERGIVKAFDLIGRRVLNAEMPWWSLPETMRSACEAAWVRPGRRDAMRDIFRRCSNAFAYGYLRRGRCGMAIQCLNADGEPVATIPGTPDADAGYHTNLSMIDALALLDALSP